MSHKCLLYYALTNATIKQDRYIKYVYLEIYNVAIIIQWLGFVSYICFDIYNVYLIITVEWQNSISFD